MGKDDIRDQLVAIDARLARIEEASLTTKEAYADLIEMARLNQVVIDERDRRDFQNAWLRVCAEWRLNYDDLDEPLDPVPEDDLPSLEHARVTMQELIKRLRGVTGW